MPRFAIYPLLLAGASGVFAKSFVADRYNVRIRVMPDTTLQVTENVRFRFEGGRFSFVSREVWKRGTDRIFDVTAAMDDVPTQPEIQETSARVRVVWHFDAPPDSTHDFLLTYRVAGAITRELDCDRLHWNAIPNLHDYRILGGEIEIDYPAGAALFRPPEVPHALAGRHEESRSVFTLPELAPNRGVPAWVEFTSGFVAEPPHWQAAEAARSQRSRAALTAGWTCFFSALMAGIAWLVRARQAIPPNAEVAPPGTEVRGEPVPVPPAVAGRLAGQGSVIYGSLGTIFDLARRGVVSVREGKRHRFGGRAYQIEPGDLSQPLLPFEREVLNLVFGSGTPFPCEFRAFLNRATTAGSAVSRSVERHMISVGLLDPNRIALRKMWLTRSLLTMLGGLVLTVIGVLVTMGAVRTDDSITVELMAAVAGIGAAVFVVAIGSLIGSATISPLSAAGASSAGPWRQTKHNLSAMTRQTSPAPAADFESWLPFAAAFGIGSAWVKRFRKQGHIPPPVWFAAENGFDDLAFVDFVSASSAGADSSSSGGDGGGGGGSGGGSSSAG